MILINSFLAKVLYDCFKLIYAYLNEGDEVRVEQDGGHFHRREHENFNKKHVSGGI